MARKVKTLFEFWGESDAELSFQVGELITVIKSDDPGWWEGELNGRRGLFPRNYVEEVAESTASHVPPPPKPIAAVNTRPPPQPLSANPLVAASRKPPPPQQALPENKPAVFSPQASSSSSSAGASAGGPSKPAGQVRGGGEGAAAAASAKRLESTTRFGAWSSNMAMASGAVMIPLGLVSLLWYFVDSDTHSFNTFLCGVYALIVGIGILLWESTFGQSRGPSRFPLRALVYLALSIFCFWSISTYLCGVFLLFVFITNFISCVLLKERYDAPPPKNHAAQADFIKVDSFSEGMRAWYQMLIQNNKKGSAVFVLIYALANLFLFAWTVNQWQEKNAGITPYSRLSDWGPWAKGFGAMLDLNCSIIVLPVSRTLLRMLYNKSTADQGTVARALRAVLEYIPIDSAITFHKIIAYVILVSAIGHVSLHFINLAFAWDNAIALFGRSAWITGGFICLWMYFIYSATPDNTRRGQFEIFWYSHHCFVLFFAFIIFHGKGGINPHYWMYCIPCLTIYAAERALRMYRSSLPVAVLSVSLMDEVLSLEFAKEGSVFEFEPYKEGQYVFLLAPSCSRVQWHPFTISSAPQEATVTVHIRVLGEGSWTRGLMQYMSALGPKGKSLIQLDRMGPSGKVPGKILGPDGRALIQIDGPMSAPCQHIGEYSTVMVIGAGIGATPVSSCLKSIVFHKWRVNIGECFPAHAHFMWVCAWRDIDAFRWLIRTIKEAQDEVVHMRATSAASMANKTFSFHIFMTSVPKGAQPVSVVVDDALGFWGREVQATKLDKTRAPFDEIDLYKVMKCPQGPHTQLTDVHVWEGRPRWADRFAAVAAATPNQAVGVTFCGNPLIAKDLRKQCYYVNKSRPENALFKLHKENF